MIDARTYLEHFKQDGARIGRAAASDLEQVVPTCPGNTVGDAAPIDPTLAGDGVDEMLDVFGAKSDHPVFKGAGQLFAGNSERLRFEATDLDKAWVVTAHPEELTVSDAGEADVTGRAT